MTLQVDGFNSGTSNCPPIHFSTYTTLNSGQTAILCEYLPTFSVKLTTIGVIQLDVRLALLLIVPTSA